MERRERPGRREEELENHDLGGAFSEINEEIEQVLAEEREGLEALAEEARSSGDERRQQVTDDVVASVFDPGEDSPLATGRASLVNPLLVRSNSAPLLATSLPAELVSHPDYEIVRMLGRGGMGVV